VKQKEIWLISLEPTIGAEISKTRPCVILNDDAIGVLPLKVIAPITDFKEKFEIVPWMITLTPDFRNNLDKVSVIDTFQVRSIAKVRLIRRIGVISDDQLVRVWEALKIVFGWQ
jgi:mRNA interferase MazF